MRLSSRLQTPRRAVRRRARLGRQGRAARPHQDHERMSVRLGPDDPKHAGLEDVMTQEGGSTCPYLAGLMNLEAKVGVQLS